MAERSLLQGLMDRKLYYGWVVVWVVFAALLVSARVRARLGPGCDLRRDLDRAPALRPLRACRRLADGPLWPQAPYALRSRPYRLEHLDGRGHNPAVAAQSVLGNT